MNRGQQVVQWDKFSLTINGQRVFIWSAEFHPFRLPSPSLWLDVFQKIKALGYSAVSFYVNWSLLEGEEGKIRTEGLFALNPFCEAAKQAGVYLLARPGPYINAEVSGGGLPGWLQRANGGLRTCHPSYLQPALNYTKSIAEILEPYQITHGGAIIAYQVENEYTLLEGDRPPETQYMAALQKTLRDSGITVPLMFNDAKPRGTFAPGSGEGSVDLYSWDGYPFGYGPGVTFCSDPRNWPVDKLPSRLLSYDVHKSFSPDTPFFLAEFQGSTVQGWGSDGPQTQCAELINHEFTRIMYKEGLINGVRIFNMYMIFGGTNWGNLGFPGTTTSYDEGAAITEERTVEREKYSDQKLQAFFTQCTPALLTALPEDGAEQPLASTSSLVSRFLKDSNGSARFYRIRHKDYTSQASTDYKFRFLTSCGEFAVPQLGNAQLCLNGRDAKIMVSDYCAGNYRLTYCTAEVCSHTSYKGKTVIVLYGGVDETHEFALMDDPDLLPFWVSNGEVERNVERGQAIFQWNVKLPRQIVKLGSNLEIHLLSRQQAYKYWLVETKHHSDDSLSTSQNLVDPSIICGPYLVRTAFLDRGCLYVTGDIIETTIIEIVATPRSIQRLQFNDTEIELHRTDEGLLSGTMVFSVPQFELPDLRQLDWKYANSLPELQENYDDSDWKHCEVAESNTRRSLSNAVSLSGGDYGFHSGSLIFRGHFKASGQEKSVALTTQGGSGSGHSLWLDGKFVGSFAGGGMTATGNNADNVPRIYYLPTLDAGGEHVFTLLIDHMGYEMQFIWQTDSMKTPRGIKAFSVTERSNEDIVWKLTGNLGGENYQDLVRGPLNEGALYVERQGWHQPGAPCSEWESRSPFQGLAEAGVGLFYTTLNLDLPDAYDIPLSFLFTRDESTLESAYRVQLFINGYQFGKYIHNLGPQTRFPVPQGVLNYKGQNTIAITLWALDTAGAKLFNLQLVHSLIVQSGFGPILSVAQPVWQPRSDAY